MGIWWGQKPTSSCWLWVVRLGFEVVKSTVKLMISGCGGEYFKKSRTWDLFLVNNNSITKWKSEELPWWYRFQHSTVNSKWVLNYPEKESSPGAYINTAIYSNDFPPSHLTINANRSSRIFDTWRVMPVNAIHRCDKSHSGNGIWHCHCLKLRAVTLTLIFNYPTIATTSVVVHSDCDCEHEAAHAGWPNTN